MNAVKDCVTTPWVHEYIIGIRLTEHIVIVFFGLVVPCFVDMNREFGEKSDKIIQVQVLVIRPARSFGLRLAAMGNPWTFS
jgi:hypothetical protein